MRVWRGLAAGPEQAEAYRGHFAGRVCPELAELAGHRGASLLQRRTEAGFELLAVTLWDSLEAIKAFAGDDPEVAVVEPEARAVLADFDESVSHYELAHSANFG